MKLTNKLEYLQSNHMDEWLQARKDVEETLSRSQGLFCICGRLATGLHENGCRKFHDKVTSEAVKKLKHLIPSKAKKVKKFLLMNSLEN